MQRSLFLATVLIGAAGVAQAQQGAMQLAEVENESTMIEQFDLTVDEIEGMEIMSTESGEEIGDVDEALMDDQQQIVAVSAEVGGFLGVDEKEIVFQIDQLRHEGGHLVTDMTRDQVEELETWTE